MTCWKVERDDQNIFLGKKTLADRDVMLIIKVCDMSYTKWYFWVDKFATLLVYNEKDELIAVLKESIKRRYTDLDEKERDIEDRMKKFIQLEYGMARLEIKNKKDYYWSKLALEQVMLMNDTMQNLYEILIRLEDNVPFSLVREKSNVKDDYIKVLKPEELL